MSRADTHWPRPRTRAVLAWGLVVASTLVLSSLFQAVAGRALGGPATTTSVVAAGDGQERAPACTSLFGSYNWWLFSSDRQGPCGLGPDGMTPMPVQLASATALPPVGRVGDGDDARAVDLACVSRVASYESLYEVVRRCSIPAVGPR